MNEDRDREVKGQARKEERAREGCERARSQVSIFTDQEAVLRLWFIPGRERERELHLT